MCVCVCMCIYIYRERAGIVGEFKKSGQTVSWSQDSSLEISIYINIGYITYQHDVRRRVAPFRARVKLFTTYNIRAARPPHHGCRNDPRCSLCSNFLCRSHVIKMNVEEVLGLLILQLHDPVQHNHKRKHWSENAVCVCAQMCGCICIGYMLVGVDGSGCIPDV